MSLNSKKICFSLVLAAAAGMVQAANSSCLLADAGFVAVQDNTASAGNYSSNRPKEKQRLFRSTAVEKEIARVQKLLKNRKLSWMFANCFPNRILLCTSARAAMESLILLYIRVTSMLCGCVTQGRRYGHMCSLPTTTRN